MKKLLLKKIQKYEKLDQKLYVNKNDTIIPVNKEF